MELTKLLVKTKEGWVHLCYIESELLQKFRESSKNPVNECITEWYKQDYKADFKIATQEDLKTLRGMIREHYKTAYPEVVLDGNTDRQGWTRVWITNKMKAEVENGKEC